MWCKLFEIWRLIFHVGDPTILGGPHFTQTPVRAELVTTNCVASYLKERTIVNTIDFGVVGPSPTFFFFFFFFFFDTNQLYNIYREQNIYVIKEMCKV